jgi:catechol 2,3-dioxygenase-like lactoylglutathione lyase family enzyme
MLRDRNATATVAVKDIGAARRFYEGTLGLKVVDERQPTALVFRAGESTLLVYKSQFAGSNQATGVTWAVGADLARIVQGLKGRGVVFEHYDMPGMTLEGDIHVGSGIKNAWFKDPDGNIHSLIDG